MLCERCKKNEATVYYSENYNGKEKKYNLCAECASEMEKNGEISMNADMDMMNMGLGSLFGGLMLPGFFGQGGKKLAARSAAKRCPLCGATFDDLAAEGMVGCPECYAVFEEELSPSVSRLHHDRLHTGRIPLKLRHAEDKRKKIETLEKQLKEAVKAEEYEKAAELRDKIRAAKEKLK